MSQLQMQYLNIRLQESYEPNPGSYKGSVKFRGQHGEIEVQLDAALSAEVLRLVAGSLTRATQELAQTLTASVIEGAKPALEAPL